MHRLEVFLKPSLPDARGLGLVKDIADLGITTVSDARVVDIYWLDADLTPEQGDLIGGYLLSDPVTQNYRSFALAAGDGWSAPGTQEGTGGQPYIIEVAHNPGVTDPVESTVMKAIKDLGVTAVKGVKTARRYLIHGQLDEAELDTICSRLLVNPIIQH
ncbi:MAG: phosphoribosylformylglycinamidine synthase subunit PurS, partial [Chloroflexi bacterium]|nr:phosphoribosylformylglycinamidine synthase subunit PurS [Chloroflexota bacterium]